MTKFFFPSSLNKLALHDASISNCAASTIVELPNLERLSFVECKFENDEWDVRDVEFSVLKSLKFKEVVLRQWHASESSFPMLEKLVLIRCADIEKIPDSFVDVETLKVIKVISCRKTSLKLSAWEIKEEVEERTGSDDLEIYIYPPYSRGTVDEITEDTVAACKKIFSRLDTDGDGLVSTEVIMETYKPYLRPYQSESELQDMINEADADGDGAIDFPQFVYLMVRRYDYDGKWNEKALREIFRQMDEDEDGYVSQTTIRGFVVTYGERTEQEADQMIRLIALNAETPLSYKQFAAVTRLAKDKHKGSKELAEMQIAHDEVLEMLVPNTEPAGPNCCCVLLCCLVPILCCLMGHCH